MLLLLALDVFLAISFFSKGVVGIAIPVLGIAGYLLWRRRIREFARPLALGIGFAALLAATWLWAVGREVGVTGVLEFLLHNQVARFFTQSMAYVGGHERPVFYYLYEAPVQFLPWSPVVALAAAAAVVRWRDLGEEERGGLALSACVVLPLLLVLSVAGTKRGVYLLPLAPAQAMTAAWWIATRAPRRAWEQRIETSWRRIVLALCASMPSLPVVFGGASPLWTIATLVLAGLAVASERGAANPTAHWTRALILVNAAWACLLAAGPPALDPLKNFEPLARDVDRGVPERATLYALHSSETLRGLLSFYTGRSTVPVSSLPALSILAKSHPGAWVVVEMGHRATGLPRLREAAIPFVLHETVEVEGRGAWIIELDPEAHSQ
jgi:4-amino-4-deoxy-L-arabinose transferase-like glycosyltransferase